MHHQQQHVTWLNSRSVEFAREHVDMISARLAIHAPRSPAAILAEKAAQAVERLQKELTK